MPLITEKHNSQYPPIVVKILKDSHDRFLIIDDIVYHVGASLIDLGKKWFAIMKMEDKDGKEILGRLLKPWFIISTYV